MCVADLQSVGVQVFKTGKSVRLVFPSDKLFAWDSANLNDYYRVPLVDAAHLIHSYDTVSVKVAAYSDTILRANGPVDRKWALTERQAQIVANDLWRHGVDTRLISAFGYNSHYPVAWNATTAGQQQNRRVEITFRFYPKHNQYG